MNFINWKKNYKDKLLHLHYVLFLHYLNKKKCKNKKVFKIVFFFILSISVWNNKKKLLFVMTYKICPFPITPLNDSVFCCGKMGTTYFWPKNYQGAYIQINPYWLTLSSRNITYSTSYSQDIEAKNINYNYNKAERTHK